MDSIGDEKNKKEIGAAEIGAGTIAGVAVATLASSMFGKSAPPKSAIPTNEDLLNRAIARIDLRREEISFPIFEEFRRINPPPRSLSKKAAKDWADAALKHLNESPVYQEFIETERKIAVTEHANLIKDTLEKMGKPSTVDNIIKAMDEANKPVKISALKKPLLAFNSLSMGGKIGVGAVVAASAVGMAMLVNKWRNKEDSFEAKLNQERAEPTFRTLSDM